MSLSLLLVILLVLLLIGGFPTAGYGYGNNVLYVIGVVLLVVVVLALTGVV